MRYQKAHSILGIDEKQNIVTAKLDELNKELTEAQTDRIQKEANYKLAQTADPSVFAKASPTGASSLLDKLLEKEADLNTAYAQATTQFGTGYPKVVELGNQLKQVRIEIQSEQVKNAEQDPRRVFRRASEGNLADICVRRPEATGESTERKRD